MPSLHRFTAVAAAASLAFSFTAAVTRRAVAQGAPRGGRCEVDSSRVALAAESGRRIRSVSVAGERPRSRSRLGDAAAPATRPATIRRELLFAAGDTVDTLRVAESLRRVRALGYVDDVRVEARTCDGAGGVDLTVVTRDAWSVTPIVRLRPRAATVGLAERNLLGTGRAARVAVESGPYGVGGSASLTDPALLGAPLVAELSAARFATGNSWLADVRTRERTVADPWTAELGLATSARAPRSIPGTSVFDRAGASLLVGRRLTSADAPSALYLLAGAESERARLLGAPSDFVVGPRVVHRDYVGADLGAALRATRGDTATWLLPTGRIADVPRGLEGELIAGVGRDRAFGRPATHLDAWAGRAVLFPERRLLLVGDAWASGYAGDEYLAASTVRASLAAVAAAPAGTWTARLSAERLANPDPDVRALATLDPTAPLLRPASRLAEGAMAASLERAWHVATLRRLATVDAALLAAGSLRWDAASAGALPGEGSGRVGIAALGVGLRLLPDRNAASTLRLDLLWPVERSSGVRRGPVLAFSVSPWFIAGRQRDGRRSGF